MDVVKRLNVTNFNELQDFVSKKMENSELKEDYLRFVSIKSYKYLDQSQQDQILLGCFNNNKLVATMGMSFSTTSPTWLLFYMITNKHSFNYNLNENGLASLMHAALDLAESRQIYRYFTFIKKRILPLTFDKWPLYVPRLKNYTFVIEEVIPANTKSKYPLFFELAFKKTYSEDYIVRSATAHDSIRIYKDAYNQH